MTKKHPNIGSSLDDLLKEKGILEEVNAAVLKRVIALQIEDEMRRRKIRTGVRPKGHFIAYTCPYFASRQRVRHNIL